MTIARCPSCGHRVHGSRVALLVVAPIAPHVEVPREVVATFRHRCKACGRVLEVVAPSRHADAVELAARGWRRSISGRLTCGTCSAGGAT